MYNNYYSEDEDDTYERRTGSLSSAILTNPNYKPSNPRSYKPYYAKKQIKNQGRITYRNPYKAYYDFNSKEDALRRKKKRQVYKKRYDRKKIGYKVKKPYKKVATFIYDWRKYS